MPLGISSRTIRERITARTSMRYVFALGAAACATVALGAAGAHAQAPHDPLQLSHQDALAGAAQILPVNASVLPINANVPICASLTSTCENSGNSANQETDQGNQAGAIAVNHSRQSGDPGHHGGRDPQLARQDALAGAAQVLPINASALPVNANVPVCASLLGSCSNADNSANQLVGQNNSAQAIAANHSRQGGDSRHDKDCHRHGGDPGGASRRRHPVQVADQSALAGAAQVLPINASALPVNANVPVCLAVGSCGNAGNSANQAILQRNSADAAALNSSDQGQRGHGGDDRGDPTRLEAAKQFGLAGALQALPVNASVLPVNPNVPVCATLGSCANTGNSANQLIAQNNASQAGATNDNRQSG